MNRDQPATPHGRRGRGRPTFPSLAVMMLTSLVALSALGPATGRSQPEHQKPERGADMTMTLDSPAFSANRPIPAIHTCDGRDLSPPLRWSGLPAGTRSLVLIVDDPDAPDPRAPRMTWVHWLLYNLPPDINGLPEGAATRLPPGTRQGLNDWRRTGYGGPCPPIGRHRYFFKLHALDTLLPDLGRPDKSRLEQAIEGHVLEKATLIGTYKRP